MSDDGSDLCVRELPRSPPWATRRKRIVRRANRERHQAIRGMVIGAFSALTRALQRWNDRQRARAALLSMTDYELRDIGISRTAMEAAIRRYEGESGGLSG